MFIDKQNFVKCAISSVTIKLCETDKNNNLDMLRLPALLKPIRLWRLQSYNILEQENLLIPKLRCPPWKTKLRVSLQQNLIDLSVVFRTKLTSSSSMCPKVP